MSVICLALAAISTITVPSSLDGVRQRCYWEAPTNSVGKVPLLVSLHTWSKDYRMSNPVPPRWCAEKGWAYLAPDFRGPNKKPKALGSDFAVQDIVDAVDWAKKHADIDPDRIYLMGGSGGGHMALLMAGRHPEIWAGVVAFCPISDVGKWYEHHTKKGSEDRYAQMMHTACEGTLAEKPEEYAHRSSLSYLGAKTTCPVYIGTGIHDGWKGSVPVSQAMWAYNRLAAEADRIPEDVIDTIVKTQKVPVGWTFDGKDPDYTVPIHLRKTSGKVRFTLFEGAHDILPTQGLHWLENQVKGRPPVWDDLPPLAAGFPLEKWGLAK